MIYTFGDSHARKNFENTNLPITNCSENSITMHRIGRDKIFPYYSKVEHSSENIFIFSIGEVDCRCHIGKQMRLGRDFNEICETLIKNYIEAIKQNFTLYKFIILCFIVPPKNREEYEKKYNDFPFIGTDEERIMITKKMNLLLKREAMKNGYIFLDCYDYYKNNEGTLSTELSDDNVHVGNNSKIIEKLKEIII